MVVYPVCVTDWAWRACGIVHQNYCSCCVLKVTRWKSAYQALNTCVQMQCLRTTALFNFGRSAQFASLWKAPPLFMTTEGIGPLIQMFLGWKILTDKCSPLSILWEVVSDCVTYKMWSMYHMVFVGKSWITDCTNFKTIWRISVPHLDYITPLCEVPSLSGDLGRKHLPVIQAFLAQNFNGHGIKLW